MKILKNILIILLVAFVGIQFVPTERNRSETVPKSDFMVAEEVPASVENIIRESCYDCHSNNTHYPWYNKLQPVTWILENHIAEGKKELNFSEWCNYSDRRKNSKLNAIIHQVEDDEMPLFQYTAIHRRAKLSVKDKKEIIEWANKMRTDLR